jgi:phage recombination protein Bet
MRKAPAQPPDESGGPPVPLAEQKIQKETVIEYLKAFNYERSLSESEKNQFIQTAMANNLDPFKREIYIVVYGDGEYRNLSILTGYQVYLKRAERTGNLDGWRAWLDGEGSRMKAVVEIFRKDWSHSFTHEVYWEEAVQKKKDGNPTQFWAKQPRFQLRKVAIAQGFRLAFPDELGSLPYDSSEIPGTENTNTETARTTGSNTNPPVNPPDRKPSADGLAREALRDTPAAGTATAPAQSRTGVNTENTPDTAPSNDTPLMARSPEQLRQNVSDLLNRHPGAFTEKHKQWILDKTNRAAGKTEIIKMLNYAGKVVQKANSGQDTAETATAERSVA